MQRPPILAISILIGLLVLVGVLFTWWRPANTGDWQPLPTPDTSAMLSPLATANPMPLATEATDVRQPVIIYHSAQYVTRGEQTYPFYDVYTYDATAQKLHKVLENYGELTTPTRGFRWVEEGKLIAYDSEHVWEIDLETRERRQLVRGKDLQGVAVDQAGERIAVMSNETKSVNRSEILVARRGSNQLTRYPLRDYQASLSEAVGADSQITGYVTLGFTSNGQGLLLQPLSTSDIFYPLILFHLDDKRFEKLVISYPTAANFELDLFAEELEAGTDLCNTLSSIAYTKLQIANLTEDFAIIERPTSNLVPVMFSPDAAELLYTLIPTITEKLPDETDEALIERCDKIGQTPTFEIYSLVTQSTRTEFAPLVKLQEWYPTIRGLDVTTTEDPDQHIYNAVYYLRTPFEEITSDTLFSFVTNSGDLDAVWSPGIARQTP